MRLQDIMSRNVRPIPATDTVGEARAIMRVAGVRHLVVVEGGSVVGIVSERELGGAPGARRSQPVDQAALVGGVMSRDVMSAEPEMTVRQAASRLRGRGIGCLAVLEEDELLGIVTTTDLLDRLGRTRS